MLWFSADGHYDHDNICKYAERPFSSTFHMNMGMVASWNHVVDHDDKVIYAGDFTLGNKEIARRYFSMLNGHIIVLGDPEHHDHRWVPHSLGPSNFYSGSGHQVVISREIYHVPRFEEDRLPIVVCHFQMATWHKKHYGAWHLYGHSHTRGDRGSDNSLNIGVDNAAVLLGEYRPFHLDEVRELIRGQV